MFLDVVQAKRNINKPIEFLFTQKLDDGLLSDYNAKFLSDLELKGQYYMDAQEDIQLEAQMLLKVEFLCARCGKPVIKDLTFNVEETFTSVPSEDNYVYSSNRIELNQLITDNLFLNLPYDVVCSENCKGRCPVCGIDRNIADCKCSQKQSTDQDQKENPFSVLKSLKKK